MRVLHQLLDISFTRKLTSRSIFFACHSRWDDSIDFCSSLTEKPSESKLLWASRLLAIWRETKWGRFLSFSYRSPENISSHPFLVFISGVDKIVFLDTALASQQPSYSPVRAEELLCSDTCSAWSRLQFPQPNCDYTDILLFALAVEKCWVMYAQWWQWHSYMCFIVLQYLSFHGYHRNCRFAIQIGRRDSEHQPICYSLLNLILLSWAQTCFSLSGAICWSPSGTAVLCHCWAASGETQCTRQIAPLPCSQLSSFWAGKMICILMYSRSAWGEVSSLVVGYSATPQV